MFMNFNSIKKMLELGQGERLIGTVPTCDTCSQLKSRLEMVAPSVTGTVPCCKITNEILIPYPKECEKYKKNLRTKISETIELL